MGIDYDIEYDIESGTRSHLNTKVDKEADPEKFSADDIFNCTQCGQCCTGFGGTYVNKGEIERIAAFIGCDPLTFAQQYCDRSGSKLVITQGSNGACVFFDKNCTIHPVKPYMCRAWPFLRTIIKNPENWEAMAKSCPGMRRRVPENILSKITAMEVKSLDSSYPSQEK